jgi:hypothetical protein
VEDGAAGDVDVVRVGPGIGPDDVAVVRLDDGGLLLEVARDDGFLIDSMTVAAHFAGPETGVERVEFDDGNRVGPGGDRRARPRRRLPGDGRRGPLRRRGRGLRVRPLPADPQRHAQPGREHPGDLRRRGLRRHGGAGRGRGALRLRTRNFNGDAFFDYTATDGISEIVGAGEVVVRPVNDAPEAADDGPIMGDEDEFISIPIADLLANDFDVDGDDLRIIGFGKLLEEDGTEITGVESLLENATSGNAALDFFSPNVIFKGSGDHFGSAGFSYVVVDGQGGTATANVEIELAAVNDAPRPKKRQLHRRRRRSC